LLEESINIIDSILVRENSSYIPEEYLERLNKHQKSDSVPKLAIQLNTQSTEGTHTASFEDSFSHGI